MLFRSMKKWESRDLGEAKEYLGMCITRDRKKRSLILDQSKYVEKVVKCFGQENCKETVVPLPTRYSPHAKVGEVNTSLKSKYQSIIGSLLYIILRTRPDFAYSVIKMLQYSSNPLEEHLQKAMQIVHYLAYTQTLCITYTTLGNQSGLIAYSDTDWTGDVGNVTIYHRLCYIFGKQNCLLAFKMTMKS